ncbi:MAG TPA: RagB/SusD family nutrient uptake outer membrane protein [Mariniflexile sp.]|nr:RagB/SusD family nutrient uptake outer membrane protein [Mariniflexile sp.]
MNTKIYFRKICSLSLLSIMVLLSSCSSFLEQEPGSKTSITEQLATKEGVLLALAGVYTTLEASVKNPRFAVYSDLQGGNLKFTPKASGNNLGSISTPATIENVYGFEDQAIESDFESVYDGFYAVINQTNLILEFVDALTDASETEKNQIKAEVLTIRAYCHFLLSNLYSQSYNYTPNASHPGVVYNKTTLTKGITYPARETAFNTYKLIIGDIKDALALFTNTNALPTGPNYSYFNSYVAKALLARVYLYQNDWKNAFDMADDVIKNSGVVLMTKENYITQWEQPDLPVSEILLEFSIPRDDDGSIGSSMAQYFGYALTSPTIIYSSYVATNDLLSLYETTDVRRNLFTEINLPTFMKEENSVRIYQNLPYFFTRKFKDNAAYVAFRLSEMYLIRAEASLGLNNLDAAKNDIDILRARANASLLQNTNNLEDAILLERRKELCFEGHLLFDLARRKKNIVRTDGCIATTCNLSYPSLKFILPIPQDNIDLNTNIKQNESY